MTEYVNALEWLQNVMLDEDDLGSDSQYTVASQQSIKAYSDTQAAATLASANSYTDTQIAGVSQFTQPVDLSSSLSEYHSCSLTEATGLILDSNLYENVFVPASLMKASGLKAPDFEQCCDNGSGSTGLYTYAFDDSTEEELFGGLVITRKWDPTTTIIPVVFWVVHTESAESDTISWGLEYVMPSLVDRMASTTTIIGGNTHYPADSVLVPYKVYSTMLTPITPPASPFNCMQYRIFRDATGSLNTDSYGHDVSLGAVGLLIQINRLGCPYSEI